MDHFAQEKPFGAEGAHDPPIPEALIKLAQLTCFITCFCPHDGQVTDSSSPLKTSFSNTHSQT
jgi:hypothetical protein